MKKMIRILVFSFLLSPVALLAVTPVTVNFTAEDPYYPTGPVVGVGSFTYDLERVADPALIEMFPANEILIGFTFEVLGQTFTEYDANDYPLEPWIALWDGVAEHINYFVLDREYGGFVDIEEPNVVAIQLGGTVTPDGIGGYTTDMFIDVVPEPTTLTLLGLGSLALVMGRRRR